MTPGGAAVGEDGRLPTGTGQQQVTASATKENCGLKMERDMRSGIHKATRRRVAMAALALATATTPLAALADESDAKIILKAMSDYLAAQEAIAFDYDATLEVVTSDDQKLGIASSGAVRLDRPDRLRATRANGFVDVEMIFDGKMLTLLGKDANVYTTIEVPGSVDHLIDELRDTYGLPLPAADLLMQNPYDALMGEVTDVKDLGSGMVGGVECDWLAFRTEQVDWQIWIAQGQEPYPCRYVITTKGMDLSPQYTVQLRDWKTGDAAGPDDFAFANPTQAAEIPIDKLRESVSDLPGHFAEGAKQ